MTMSLSEEFTEEQKQYLQGFMAGGDAARTQRGLPTFAAALGLAAGAQPFGPQRANPPVPALASPDDIHEAARQRFISAGKKLTNEEEAKRKKHPFEMWDEMRANADAGRFPKGTDVFLYKYHGLFHVAPAQDAFMCRLRIAGGILRADQMREIARVAKEFGGGYAHVTTRANFQIREIRPENALHVITGLEDAGIITRGSGADNIRNVTGSPTAGIDPQELIDVRPLCREMHHYILHHREMYGLPRKFNIAFDGGGAVSALEDTNDIGFTAVRVGPGHEVPEGVYFRMQLGGITGHRDFARDTGVLLKPSECVPVAAAIVRVFIDHGDRTDRKKARLKYVLDAWGFEKYLTETEKHLPQPLRRFPLEKCAARPAVARMGHVGFHPQKQPGLAYVGVAVPVGHLTCEQMLGLADIASQLGSGTIRLTVWQNLIISDIPEDQIGAVEERLQAIGLTASATSFRAGVVACTGNAGCKFAASNTKRHALEIVDRLDQTMIMDNPLNIHLTGCHHSCAQHYIGDIGLLGAKVEVGDDVVEGYRIFLGGGYGDNREIAREIFPDVQATDAPALIESLTLAYQERRHDRNESFQDFTRRHSDEELKEMAGQTEEILVP